MWSEVVCAGRLYLMAWEDGMTGIYKLEDKSSVGVAKNHMLLDTSETPILTDNLADKVEKQARELIMPSMKSVTNDVSLKRASALLGICDDLDAFEQPSKVAAVSVSASAAPAPRPSLPQEEHQAESESVLNLNMSSGVLSGLRNRLQVAAAEPKPKGAGAGAAPKVKAKPKAKGAAGPPATDGSEPAAKRRRVTALDAPSSKSAPNATQKMIEEDKLWKIEIQKRFDGLLDFSPRAPENEFKADVAETSKNVTNLITALRTKLRVVKRRSEENQQPAMQTCDDFIEQVVVYQDFLKNLNNKAATPADEVCAKCQVLKNQSGAKFGKEVYLAIARLRWQHDMQYKRWSSMLSDSFDFAKTSIGELDPDFDMDSFLGQQFSCILQKLVKNINMDKATRIQTGTYVMLCYVSYVLSYRL